MLALLLLVAICGVYLLSSGSFFQGWLCIGAWMGAWMGAAIFAAVGYWGAPFIPALGLSRQA
jgi:hypothetical protein